MQRSSLRICQTLNVVLSWVFEVYHLSLDNTLCLSQSDLQLLSLNLPEPVGTNAVVEASVQHLVLDWVFKQFEDLHDHLPSCQIFQ